MTGPDDPDGPVDAPPVGPDHPARADETPLPRSIPHHVSDPTTRPQRILPSEIAGDFDDLDTKPVITQTVTDDDNVQTRRMERIKPPDGSR